MKKLVILGGGYGGKEILETLIDKELPKDVEITLIDKNPYHSLKTEFYALAAGTASDRSVRLDFPKHNQVQYIFKEITHINLEKKQVELKGEEQVVPYDYLIIGLGCEDHYHDVKGADQHTHSLQTMRKARETSYAVTSAKAYGDILVIGAGLSGIEIAAEVRESRPDLNVKLLDRGSAVLKTFDPKVQQYVEKWYGEHDVEVIHKVSVDLVEPDSVYNNGVRIRSDVTIWTAGVRPHRLVRNLPFEKDSQDRIILNPYHQVPTHPEVYVVGDCASLSHSPSAQLAQHQGVQIANVLYSLFKGEEPKVPGDIKLRGTLGSLGKHDGFGSIFDLPFIGLVPRLAKTGVLWMHKRH